MTMTASEILKRIIENEKISYNKLAQKMGIPRSQSLYDIRDGKIKNISHAYADRIRSVYPNYSRIWLLTGEGSMRTGDTLSFERSEICITNDYKLVPMINMDAVGGMHSPNAVFDEPEYIIRRVAFNDAKERDKCIQVSGDSMEPVCPAGSIVLIRQVECWREYFGFGNIFVLLLNDGRRILKKVIKCDSNSQEYVTCVSLNKEYPVEDLPKDFIVGVWKVIKILVNKGW